MASIRRALFLASLIIPVRNAPAQSCDFYTSVLASAGADSSGFVLIDRAVVGVPQFAFNAWSSIVGGDTAMLRDALPKLRAASSARPPVPECLAKEHAWKTVSDSVLFEVFRTPGPGRWDKFHERFQNAKGFILMSQPAVSGDTATIYVGIAKGELNGRGVVVRFVRGADGHWVKQSEAQFWIS